MKTKKAISNISYLLPIDFEVKVNELRKSGVIGPCLYCHHKAEGDDKKDHTHFVLLGGFKEYEKDGLHELFGFSIWPDGQKGTVTKMWTPSKVDHFVCYCSHHRGYLGRYGKRADDVLKTEYGLSAIKCTEGDEDCLEQVLGEAQGLLDTLEDRKIQLIKAAAFSGVQLADVLSQGLIALGEVNQAKECYRIFSEQASKKMKVSYERDGVCF